MPKKAGFSQEQDLPVGNTWETTWVRDARLRLGGGAVLGLDEIRARAACAEPRVRRGVDGHGRQPAAGRAHGEGLTMQDESTMEALPEGVRRVSAALKEAGHPHAPLMLSDSARTAQQAADALGVAVGQIAKSIVFRRKSDDQ